VRNFRSVAQDTAGNALANTSVAVYYFNTLTLATLYSDNWFSVKANPFLTDADGSYEFYCPNGRYSAVLTKTGYSFVPANTVDLEMYDYCTPVEVAIVGTVNNLTSPNQDLWRITGSSTPVLTGVVPRQVNQKILLLNAGPTSVVLTHEGASTAGNRFLTYDGNNITLPQNNSVSFWYDAISLRWRRIS
jgi:hypothetical protein